jgi:membrane-bound lytic murein transglycosylase A
MKQAFRCILIIIALFITSCKNSPVSDTKQYESGEFSQSLNLVQLHAAQPINIDDYRRQIALIKLTSPSLYNKNADIYAAIEVWLNSDMSKNGLNYVGLNSYQLAGIDSWGNTHLTSYYTPELKARRTPDEKFRYPLYAMPTHWKGKLPTRGEIYQGALDGLNLELAYTDSLVDNFLMEVQGSAYIDFEDGSPLVFFGYKGKNKHKYKSIGRLMVEQGIIDKQAMSMQSIKAWADKQTEVDLMRFLQQNESFVFFTPQLSAPVIGSTGVPLVAKSAVAADNHLLAPGSVLLVEMPLLNQQGKFTGQRELRLMVVLDVGGAINGQHLDIYQGIGPSAGQLAGFYNHYGRVWLIAPAHNSHVKS